MPDCMKKPTTAFVYASNEFVVPQNPYVHMICTKFNQLISGKLNLVSILPKLSEIHLA